MMIQKFRASLCSDRTRAGEALEKCDLQALEKCIQPSCQSRRKLDFCSWLVKIPDGATGNQSGNRDDKDLVLVKCLSTPSDLVVSRCFKLERYKFL